MKMSRLTCLDLRHVPKAVFAFTLTAAAVISTPKTAYAANNNCGQAFRQLSLTTAHTIAGMICTLHANNSTEKHSRTENNSFNFVHSYSVDRSDDGYKIEGTCSTSIKYYSQTQHRPDIAHPGFKLALTLPEYDDTCSPTYKGTLTEIKPRPETVYDQVRKVVIPKNQRTIEVVFHDTGYRSTSSDEFIGSRSLRSIRLGHNLHSIFASGLSSSAINQGFEDRPNEMAVGAGKFTQEQFFYKTGSGLFKPDFSRINAIFQMNKALDPSLANRDALRLVGNSTDLYIRQNGVTNFLADTEREILPERNQNYHTYDRLQSSVDRELSRGASNVFYIHNYDLTNKIATVKGCSDYSYSGDYNTTAMTASDCRMRIQSLP